MYHIPNDKRAHTSASLLLKAFQCLLKDLNYEEITISDICSKSTISRATFYRLFDSKEDLVSWGLDLFTEQFCAKTTGYCMKEKMESCFTAWMENTDMLEMVAQLGKNNFPCVLSQHSLKLIAQQFWKMDMTPYHIAILTPALEGILMMWVQCGKKETPSQLVNIFCNVIDDIKVCISEA